MSEKEKLHVASLYLRSHSDKQHVRGPEEDVRAVTQPDVPQCVHDEHTHGHQQGEDTQSQLPPHGPAHGQVAHQQSCQSPCGPQNTDALLEILFIHRFRHICV